MYEVFAPWFEEPPSGLQQDVALLVGGRLKAVYQEGGDFSATSIIALPEGTAYFAHLPAEAFWQHPLALGLLG